MALSHFGIDWLGAIIISTALALLSSALAIISEDMNSIRQASTIAYFVVSGVLLVCFVLWQEFQERRNKPTLIRNSLWKNLAFSSICANAFIIWDVFNGFEQIINFFLRNVQELSVIQTAIRFIPSYRSLKRPRYRFDPPSHSSRSYYEYHHCYLLHLTADNGSRGP